MKILGEERIVLGCGKIPLKFTYLGMDSLLFFMN